MQDCKIFNETNMKENIDKDTVDGFGDEWSRFNQSELDEHESNSLFEAYFKVFPWSSLSKKSIGFDLGCGSGRWAKKVAPLVGKLHCIDPSAALEIAKENIHSNNCEFHLASVDNMPIKDNSMDFGYSIGVLHHIPDTQSAITSCVNKLKKNAPLLVYIYYSLDDRPFWFRLLWRLSDYFRLVVSRLPYNYRYLVSQMFAIFIYLPLSRFALLCDNIGIDVDNFPLSAYRKLSFYTMRTDALDRFGTRLEQRFSKNEIISMMKEAGLNKIKFSPNSPFWCAVGYKK